MLFATWVCYFTVIILLTAKRSIGVSVRRRKNKFGLQWAPDQPPSQVNVSAEAVDQQQEGGSTPNQPSGKSSKRKKKSTEAVKAFYKRKKAERDKGDPRAIEMFKERNTKNRLKSQKQRDKIFSGQATEAEKEHYNQILARNRRYKKNNRDKINAYKKQKRAQQKAEKDT